MKRDRTGKFIHSWGAEPKQAVNLSLTKTAWQLLEQQARECGISRSELVERYARSLQSDTCLNNIGESDGKASDRHQIDHKLEALITQRTSQLCQTNAQLQQQIIELQRTVEDLQLREQNLTQAKSKQATQEVIEILESITDAFLAYDCQWRYTYVNEQAVRLLRKSREELIGNRLWDVFPDLCGTNLERMLRKTVDEQTPLVFEDYYAPFDTWVEIHAYPSPDGLSLFVRDITQRKQLEQALQQQVESEENQRQWLKAVLNLLPIPLILSDPHKGRVTFSNQAANEMAGTDISSDRLAGVYNEDYHCTDVTGKFIPPDQLPSARAVRGEKIQGEELNWHNPTGVYPLLVYADTLPAMYNHPTTSVVVFQNIRDRKQIELQLQESQRFIQQVADATPGVLYIYDLLEQRNIYVNRQIGEILGYTPEQIQAMGSQLFPKLMHPDDFATLPAQLERLNQAQDGEVIELEYRMQHANGEWHWLWSRDLIFTRTDDGSPQQVIGISHDISDRKQAEEALRLSQQHYRLLAESLPQLVCMADADGITNYCNQSWIDYTGLAGEQTVGKGWQQAFHPDELPFILERWTEALKDGNAYSLEFRIKRFDGVYRWHLSRILPIKAEDGSIVGWLGTATDIDRQKRSEQRERFLAQASQTFAATNLDLQTLLDTITQLVSELTGDVCVLNLLSENGQWLNHVSCYHVDPEVREFVNELLNTYPRRVDEGIGGRVMQTGEPLLIPVTSQQEFGAAIKPEYQLYLQRFQVCSTLILPLKVQGTTIGVLSLTRHHPGEPHNYQDQSLFQDLADRAAMAIANAQLYQQAQQAAARTARLQEVTAALCEALTPQQVAKVIVDQGIAALGVKAGAVVLLTENGNYVQPIEVVGYPQNIIDSWKRFPVTAPVPLAETVRTQQPIFLENVDAIFSQYPHLREVLLITGSQAMAAIPLIAEGRTIGGLGISFAEAQEFRDNDKAFILTLGQQCAQAIARAQLYEAEREARDEAEAANRTKDEFLAVLSHELRTPLNPILGWTRLLRSGKLDAKKAVLALETIERNAKLQVQLIEDLLDISRILQGKLSLNSCPVDLASTIADAIETIHLAAEAKKIQIQTHFAANVGDVLGDAARLQQVVWNLLSNAVKFTPTNGRVEIRLETTGSQAQILVKDTGRGINPEFLPYVFDYFRQADSSITRTFGGLGLGLAIARHIVELHGGTIEAESPGIGQGATFTVTLPLMLTPTSATEVTTLAPDTLTLDGIQVLAVDDEVDNLELITFILEEAGAAVISASSGKEVLQILNQTQPDILLADIGMPQMDGYTLLRQIRAMSSAQGGQIPAIALTAYAGEINQQQALAAGFQLHMPKPVDPEALVQAIAQIVK